MAAVKSMSTALSLSAVLMAGCAESGPAGPPLATPPPAELGLDAARADRAALLLEDARARLVPALGAVAEAAGLARRVTELSAAVAAGDARAFAVTLAGAEQALADVAVRSGDAAAADVDALRRHLAETRALVLDP
jgi:hypothetical protein